MSTPEPLNTNPRSPVLQAELERIGKERLAASDEIERTERRELLRVCVEMVGCTVAGLLCVGMAFHSDDVKSGRIWMLLGMLVNMGGVFLSLLAYHHRRNERGD